MLHARIDDSQVTSPTLVHEIVSKNAALLPQETAIDDGAIRLSYQALQQEVSNCALWLRERQIRAGDRILLVCENSCSAVVLYFAITTVGAWPVLLNARLSEREIEEIRVHCGARAKVFALTGSPRARAHAQGCGAMIDESPLGSVGFGGFDESARPDPLERESSSNVAAVMYTTGTTGKPKGVMLTHAGLMFVADATANARRLGATDRVYAALPISHTLGLAGVLLGSLLRGAEVYLASRFDPGSALAALTEQQITVMVGTPSMFSMIAEYARRKKSSAVEAPALRLISSAGAPLDRATKTDVEAAFGLCLHNGYGISECGPSISVTSPDFCRSDCCVGQPLPGVEIDLKGDEPSSGELFVRSPGLMKGYYRDPEATRAAIDDDGWFRTGDLARQDTEGNLFITGRAKELIIRFGFNVYPPEIESVLNGHPAVLCSAVIGRTAGGTEEIIAFVQLREQARVSANDLQQFASQNLASYKQPSEYIIVEQIPVAANGKILKASLSAIVAKPRSERQ